MNANPLHLSRRRFLLTGLASAAALGLAATARAQNPDIGHDNGITPPRPVPDIAVRCADGRTLELAHLLKGQATALHFMFTQCTTTCPIQGSVFERVQELLPNHKAHSLQLLSLSVDPQSDTPRLLNNWLKQFHARPGWLAAAPTTQDLPALRRFFGDTGDSSAHSTEVHIINRRGEWIWRMFNLPSAEEIAELLRKMEV